MLEPLALKGCRLWGEPESQLLQGVLVLTWPPLFGPWEEFMIECGGSWLIGSNHSLILRGLAEELLTQGWK